MFACFFPRPRLFLLTAILWIVVAVAVWHLGAEHWGAAIGAGTATAGQPAPLSITTLWSRSALWFYAYYWLATGLFWAVWRLCEPRRWAAWSILGPAFIGFATHLNASLVVMGNQWVGAFYNMIQASLDHRSQATLADYYTQFAVVIEILLAAMIFMVVVNFFSSHFIFRWRTAMNDYYTEHWENLRHIEGAAQRVQEDTMRFAALMETTLISVVANVMILIAFLPLLAGLSTKVASLTLLGRAPNGLPIAALAWGVSATAVLAFAGRKLPGLQMRNQKVEAAYRKELVHGEDDPARAQRATLAALFAEVRKNYFALYLNMLAFNVPRFCFIYLDAMVSMFLLIPTILAGAITFGLFTQIINAFENVRRAFEYLASAWPQLVELLSVYGRLRSFERVLSGDPARGRWKPLAEGQVAFANRP